MKNELAYVSIIMVGILGLIVGYSMSPSTPAIGQTTGEHVVSATTTANASANVTAAPSGGAGEGSTGQAKGFATQGYGVYAK